MSGGSTETVFPTETKRNVMTFREWWYDYRIKHGIGTGAKRSYGIARDAWDACAQQEVPGYVLMALAAAHRHVEELREAWRRGVIDERDGSTATRSNRNIDVEVGLRKALEMLQPK